MRRTRRPCGTHGAPSPQRCSDPAATAAPPDETASTAEREADDAQFLARRIRAVCSVRMDRVEAVCRRLAAGDYQVDATVLADRILAHMYPRAG